jgi:hypothetical protein
MADKKISALTAASTPLAGTEVLPIVQGGSTVKVSVDNLTVGKFVRAGSFQADGPIKATSAAFGASDITAETTAASGTGFSRVILKTADREWRIVNDASTVGSPFLLFDVQSAAIALTVDNSGNFTANRGNLVIGTTAKGLTTGSSIPLGFGTNNSVSAMTLNTSGNLVIGSMDFGSKVSVFTDGVGQFIRVQQINATVMEFRNAQDVGGSITIVAGGATSYNTVSDERLKHDIVDAPDAANLIDALQVRSFKWKVDDTAQRYGFIAQELLEVAPEAVNVPEDEDKMMGVDHSKLVPMLVKEVQSLRARVAQLEGK